MKKLKYVFSRQALTQKLGNVSTTEKYHNELVELPQ